MRRALVLFAVGVDAVAIVYSLAFAQSTASALQGVWSIQSASTPKPLVPPLNKPVGLVIYSGRHYEGNRIRAPRGRN
jgi:hypothetical protein